ncbi:polysaccharide pyruvyl transferase family protein [Thermoproteota archaeon]
MNRRLINFVKRFPRVFRIAKDTYVFLCFKMQRIRNLYRKTRPRSQHPPTSKTRYAVLWASTTNIGDDIQTLAAINFLDKKGITEYSYIDREKLNDYDGEPVTMIMNSWFMHKIHKFPPSDKITPVFISFHCNNEALIKKNIPYFKRHSPIGCRDKYTLKLLNKYGIKGCFTGCLTLFFDKHPSKGNKKYLVDVNSGCSYIPDVDIDLDEYKDFIKIEHIIEDKNIMNDVNARLKKAEKLLDLYRRADSAVTSRLHCVLPCRAFNTAVVFMHKKYKTDPRFSGLRRYIDGDTTDTKNLYAAANSIFDANIKN